MPDHNDHEQSQIDSLFRPKPRGIVRRTLLYVSPDDLEFNGIYAAAIAPALRKNQIPTAQPFHVLDSDSPLDSVFERIQTAETLLFDITRFVPDVLYVLGLAHAIGRCPILLAQVGTPAAPFDLHALRRIDYDPGFEGLRDLRETLTRTIRIHLANGRATPLDDVA